MPPPNASLTKPVASFLRLVPEGLDGEAALLDQRAADKTTHGMRLPAGRLHDLRKRCTILAGQQFQHVSFLAPVFGALGPTFRAHAGRVALFALGWYLLGILLARRNTARRFGGGRFWSGAFVRGVHSDTIHHSSLKKIQADSVGALP